MTIPTRPRELPVKARITSPAPGANLTSSTVTFAWNNGSGVTGVLVGHRVERRRHAGLQPVARDKPVGDGFGPACQRESRSIVRLWSRIAGAWQFNDYSYTAVFGGTTAKAEITSPAPGSSLSAVQP